MIVLIVIQFLIIGGLIWYIQHTERRKATLQKERLVASDHFLRTAAAGIFERFSDKELSSNIFLTETETDFITFAAQIMQRVDQGTIYITYKSQYGYPHFEIERADGIYPGIAIVESADITYEKIALLHSHLIQQQAQGGYVITTSNFTTQAYEYAKNLEIELINGKQLVTYWLQAMDHAIYEKKPFSRTK